MLESKLIFCLYTSASIVAKKFTCVKYFARLFANRVLTLVECLPAVWQDKIALCDMSQTAEFYLPKTKIYNTYKS